MISEKQSKRVNNKPMFNAYPDSIGGNLSQMLTFLTETKLSQTFAAFYVLPSIFHSDLDRGFSIIDYGLNEIYANIDDLKNLQDLFISLKLDFVINHISVLSEQFQDLIKNGTQSKYHDFFINWNQFWEGHGTMNEAGYIDPHPEHLEKMFFRKPGLPILMVRMPDGSQVPYWNTFYQKITYEPPTRRQLMDDLGLQYGVADEITKKIDDFLKKDQPLTALFFGDLEKYRASVIQYLEANCNYLGQMDLNIKSLLVWKYYENVIKTLASYGCEIIRLDAFAYAPKKVGSKNFLNDPQTWELLERIGKLADYESIELLPEIHATYEEKIHELLAKKGYLTYDFFLPGLIIDVIENKNAKHLIKWANELREKKIRTVNMLGCHDGIPLLDLKGLLTEDEIKKLIDIVKGRGGYVKNLHGQKNMYYQINATYYSALGEDDKKMLLARALQLFMPGKPQVWYLDLFAGKNDYEAIKQAGAGGHKEINRTNLSLSSAREKIKLPVVQTQIKMLNMRCFCDAFADDAFFKIESKGMEIKIIWQLDQSEATLTANLETLGFVMSVIDENGKVIMLDLSK